MTASRHGEVVAFYSYKGGTGRTMALANVAWILAANGKRVLVVDWDLESPGLHRFFKPFLDGHQFADAGGIIDLVREYEGATPVGERDEQFARQYARVSRHAFSLDWPDFPGDGTIDFLGAGKQDRDYIQALANLNWDDFYEYLGGGLFFDALRDDMRQGYDYTLIDSRTGLSDIADICTVHLPDTLVDCFTLSEQGIDGAAQVADYVHQHEPDGRPIRILPVQMRVDEAEKDRLDAGRAVAKQRFGGLPVEGPGLQRDAYWTAMQVPYKPYYAYEEVLATFGDRRGTPGSLLAAYEALTAYLTNGEITTLPEIDESKRVSVVAQFARTDVSATEAVQLRYAPGDEPWAEWVSYLLGQFGIRIVDATDSRDARPLVLVSHNANGVSPTIIDPLVVYLSDVYQIPAVAPANSVRIHGLSATEAAMKILDLLGQSRMGVHGLLASGPRFPGEDPIVFQAPAPNRRFSGRREELAEIRAKLQAARGSGERVIALQGMGGVGKTQLAMEYAHRFGHAYDIVWWIDAGQTDYIDVKLGDLGNALGFPGQPRTEEDTRAVLQALARGRPHRHWLVIMDNAEDVDKIREFVPHGPGHVLITSRGTGWGLDAELMSIVEFKRSESIEHLRHRVPRLSDEEADRIAAALGDLPIAVAAAGALLNETGEAADVYLNELELHGLGPLTADAGSQQLVEKTWDISLQRLASQSRAGFRLLQLCSVMAPQIALELVYSEAMAEALKPVDPGVSDRLYRNTLVQAINRLALLKIDERDEMGGEPLPIKVWGGRGGQIVIHRLLQSVLRNRMSTEEQDEAKHVIHLVLAAARTGFDVDNADDWPRFRLLWPHLDASAAVTCTDEKVRELLIDRVRYIYLLGGHAQAYELGAQIERHWVDRLAAPIDPVERSSLEAQLLHLRFHIANALRELGQYQRSRELDEAGVVAQAELVGPTHPNTLRSAGSLGADLRGLGRFQEALQLDRETYDSWQQVIGSDHPRTLAALNNLAVSDRLMGNFTSALQRDNEVHEKRLKVLSVNHPQTLQAYGNIGRDLREAGRFEESIEILRQVTELSRGAWGDEAIGTLSEQANLAVSLRGAGKAGEAARLLDTAYKRLEAHGVDQTETLACRLSRAMNYLALENINEARRELLAVHRAYVRILGADHPHTLVCVNNLAAVARAQGDRQVALQRAVEAHEALTDKLGPDHPHTLAAQMNRAICSAELDDFEAAREQIDDAVMRTLRTLGPDHPDTLRCRANRLLIAIGSGELDAEFELEDVARLLERRLGATHGAVAALAERRYLHRTLDPHPF